MAVSVFPGAPDPSHDISLSDGTNTYGFTLKGGPRVFQEIPLSPPAQQFTIHQKNWVGGRGTINIKDDATGYYDSQNLWSSSDGKLFPAPLWRYAAGIRSDVDENNLLGSVAMDWAKLYNSGTASYRYHSTSFVASNNVSMVRAFLHVRSVGSPGLLYFEMCADNAGAPGTVLKDTSLADDAIYKVGSYVPFNWSAGALTRASGTTYHVKIYSSATDNEANHWEVLTSASGGLVSTDNSTWAAGRKMDIRVDGADSDRGWYIFSVYGAMYAVSKNDNRSNSVLMMNGFRGIASAGTGNTLTCAQACTRSYAGAYIKILDGTGDGQIRQISSNTTGASVQFTVTPAWSTTPDATSIFVVYATKYWDAVTGTPGLGYVVGPPVVMNNKAYFPQGMSVVIRRMTVNGNSHDFAAMTPAKGDILYVNTDRNTETKLWSADAGSATVSDSTETQANITTTTIGNTSHRITNMFNYGGQFIIFKEDGLYTFDGTNVERLGRNFQDISDENNGLAVADDNTYLWFTWGHSVERMLGKNITDMLNWRGGFEGLPQSRRGNITKIVSSIGWMFFVIDAGTSTSNYSSIIYWNGFGWHELFRAHEAGVRIRNIAWQECPGTNPILWVDIRGELLYITFPKNASLPIKDSSIAYCYEGVLITPTIDTGSLDTYKIIKSIKIFQDTPITGSTAQKVYVDYQKNEYVDTDTWTYLGLADAVPFEEILMNVGAISQVRFRLRINSDTLKPSVVHGWAVSGREMPLTKYQYIGTYTASTDQDTRQGEPDVSGNTTYAWLQSCAINQTKLTLRTLNTSSDNKNVTVTLPVKNVDWVDGDNWGGSFVFSCLET